MLQVGHIHLYYETSKVRIVPPSKPTSLYFLSLQFYSSLQFVRVGVLCGGSFDEEAQQGLSDAYAIFYMYFVSLPFYSSLLLCVRVCVLYGDSFDEEAQQGLGNTMCKSTYLICLFHWSSTPVFGVCVHLCVCVCVCVCPL